MTTKSKIIISLIGASLFLIFIFKDKVIAGIGCLAYHEQCTAKKIMGLTKEKCLQRKDVVAFLIEDNICLVHE